MSDHGEYAREFKLYLARLMAKANALSELGDIWSANFLYSVYRHIERQGPQQWGPTPKQLEQLTKIDQKYGELLTNKPKRDELVKRRAEFMVKFTKLKAAVDAAQDTWMQGFLRTVDQQMKQSRPLTPKQKETVQQALHRYKIAAYSYDRND